MAGEESSTPSGVTVTPVEGLGEAGPDVLGLLKATAVDVSRGRSSGSAWPHMAKGRRNARSRYVPPHIHDLAAVARRGRRYHPLFTRAKTSRVKIWMNVRRNVVAGGSSPLGTRGFEGADRTVKAYRPWGRTLERRVSVLLASSDHP